MTDSNLFDQAFAALTGHSQPLPWQCRLFERFLAGDIPAVCNLPTGLGKTAVIPVWLIALASRPENLPRRLVYVVNRRTVVDQTTNEALKLRDNLGKTELDNCLRRLCAFPLQHNEPPLAISTLRGQFGDNREWSADPSRPAVICGTVDMIGSRLLFGGYRIGFKSRPLHAGFLGQDALLIHDESHLEPAFQELIETIQCEQGNCRVKENGTCVRCGRRHRPRDFRSLHVMALSATARHNDNNTQTEDCKILELTDEEKNPPDVIPDPPTEPIHHVWRRLKATKSLHLQPCEDEKNKLAARIAEQALEAHKESGDRVLIFLRKVDDVEKVVQKLTDRKSGISDDHVEQLTGTMRGLERDELVCRPAFIRFLPERDRPDNVPPAEGTVYLVCTSAGEVGVNLSADHMVCDLSTFDSMAQRLGRVNRFGDCDDTRVDVVHPAAFDEKDKLTPARKATLELLKALHGDASPSALDRLDAEARRAAFAPEPTIPEATDILFDAWAMTTIRDRMPGRPPVAPYLHGVADWEPPRTSVAWREEVELITDELVARHGDDFPQTLLEDYPLKPHELLNDTTARIFAELQQLAASQPETRVWIIDKEGKVDPSSLSMIANPTATKKPDRQRLQERLEDAVVLLPPRLGGLTIQGTLDGKAVHMPDHPHGYDVADHWRDENGHGRRKRIFSEEPQSIDAPEGMALIRTIDTNPLADEIAPLVDETEGHSESEETLKSEPDFDSDAAAGRERFWHWFTKPRDAEEATNASIRPIAWKHHTEDVVKKTKALVDALDLPDDLKRAVVLAAELHDLGKKREQWQRSIGNPDPSDWHAKPGKPVNGPRWRPRHLSPYRHEFGSLLDIMDVNQEHVARLEVLNRDMRDVALHLIAAHHGYARPHFPPQATVDPTHSESIGADVAVEVMRRYARLQRKYGRWGLGYLESLLRAADWAASADPSDNGGKA